VHRLLKPFKLHHSLFNTVPALSKHSVTSLLPISQPVTCHYRLRDATCCLFQ